MLFENTFKLGYKKNKDKSCPQERKLGLKKKILKF